jgi:2-keto-4-pentenoate hydratase/2-oxohepta-3-ene-1,7-dioic acid hydratase in catechol pathway
MESPLPIPQNQGAVHYELELAVCLGKEAMQVSKKEALNYVAGYGMALDLTLRDKQQAAKNAGLPWAIAKGFDHSCPVSVFKPVQEIGSVNDKQILFKLNGEIKQQASTNSMLFEIDELISYISNFYTLNPGDIILTGTPAGVGPLSSGDQFEAMISGIAHIKSAII